MVLKLTRKQYTDLFGASQGDKIRLGDTDIIIEVEKDLISPGDECVFGGGKTIRDGLCNVKYDSFCLYRGYCRRAYNMYPRTLGHPRSYEISPTIRRCN